MLVLLVLLACGGPRPDPELVGLWEDDLSRAEGLNDTLLLAADGAWAARRGTWDDAPCDDRSVSRGGTWVVSDGALVLTTTWTGRLDGGKPHGEPCRLIGGHEARIGAPPTEERLPIKPCADDWGEPDCRAFGSRSWWRRATGDPVAAWLEVCRWCNPSGPGPIEE